MDEHDVGINVHNEPYPSFENRVCLHLAAGHLVLSEPLSPTHGLEPGIDYLEVGTPGARARDRALHRFPASATASASAAGRRPSSSARPASGRGLSTDLFADLAAFGTDRAS